MLPLRQIREEKGFQRKFVAKKLEIVPDHLSSIERGKAGLTIHIARKLSKLYEYSIEEIIKAYEGGKSC